MADVGINNVGEAKQDGIIAHHLYSVELFKSVTTRLLAKHYGLDLADTYLNSEQLMAECIQQNIRPYLAVNEHAEEADLDRFDIEGPYGVQSKALLTIADEIEALGHVMSTRSESNVVEGEVARREALATLVIPAAKALQALSRTDVSRLKIDENREQVIRKGLAGDYGAMNNIVHELNMLYLNPRVPDKVRQQANNAYLRATRHEWLDSDAEIRTLGVATITDVGSENVYVVKDGSEYFFKPGNTDRFQVGQYDFADALVFDDGTAMIGTSADMVETGPGM